MKSVLVVDDDKIQTRLLEGILTEKGFNVSVFNDAADGLQFAIHKFPDIIILDVMMPIINGYNFCKLLKTEARDRKFNIVLLTSRDEEDDIHIGMEMGADAYLTKPVDAAKLLHTISILND